MHALRLVNTSQVFNRRRSKRCPLDRRTTGHLRLGEQLHGCVIEDISLGGARLSFDGPMPEGEELVLEHSVAGCFPGKFVWTRDGVGGFQFDRSDRPIVRELQCIALMVSSDDTQSARRAVA